MPLINWYPGHIAKAQRTLKEKLQLIDFALELIDARLPFGSRFGNTASLLGAKPRILVLTKSDMARNDRTAAWLKYYKEQGFQVVTLNAQTGQGLPALQKVLQAEANKLADKMKARGRLPRPSRVMVVGLPNVGKSSLINKLARKKAASTGDKPGVTKSTKWVRVGVGIELMDTPGIIPMKLDDQVLALKLAMIGAVSTEAYDPGLVAPEALKLLVDYEPEALKAFLDPTLEGISLQRGDLRVGGGVDVERTARTLMRELRTGALGPLSLDFAPEEALALDLSAPGEEEAEPADDFDDMAEF
jgi:ribosome biogenesis GTPase A